MRQLLRTLGRGAAWGACLWAASALSAGPSQGAPSRAAQVSGFTLHVTNGSLPPQYAHQEELRGQVSPHSVFATYTFTHYAPNKGRPGFHDVVFTWRGPLPADALRQFHALARNVAFEKPRLPMPGSGAHDLSVTYADGRHASGTPTDVPGWERLLGAVARLAHSPKKD